MKYLLFLILVSCTPALTPQQKADRIMSQYVGMKKDALIKSLGFPSRVEDLDGNPVLIYSALKTSGLGVFARQYYEHKLFFFNYGRVESWLLQNNELPVEQLNIRVLQSPKIY